MFKLFQSSARSHDARDVSFSKPKPPNQHQTGHQRPENDLIQQLSEVIPNPADSNALEPLFEYLQDPDISVDHKNMLNKNIQWYALACLHYNTPTNLNMLGITVINEDKRHPQYPTVQDLLSNKQYRQCATIFHIPSNAPQHGNKKVFTYISHTATHPANCGTGSDDARSNSGSEFSI
jgi:hypothetical protein